MEAIKPKFAVETVIKVNEARVEAVKTALKESENLVIPLQLKEDICALIVTVEEYTKFLKDIYEHIPTDADDIH